ncbi:hypothetical protein BIW11_09785 [Tropilaelaps mercedesae]|uniref:AIMP2 thioredoxin-like domain-containing protein n=1 Tax=Tropilaelaps mercedesae TaxID=418985 RepID=A0A1V9XIZ1_9ACAR|nr:hypothetical protein BIW11_09785 [Tropilaelaps mercedesae]
MYSVKPYYNTNDAAGIDTDNVMYCMKPVYRPAVDDAAINPTEADLLSRQKHLIANIEHQVRRVDELLNEVNAPIRSMNRTSQTPPSAAIATGTAPSIAKFNVTWPETVHYPMDIVVQADPTRLPMTPWALRKLLGSAVMVRTHVHSSYNGPLPPVENDNSNANRTSGGVKIIFTVIFRNIKDMEFMVDPVGQVAVAGEANLFRYICRVFPIFAVLSAFDETVSDHYIDVICSDLIGVKSIQLQRSLKAIDVQLAKKGGLLVCDKLTPADFCLHAALQRHSSLDLPQNVQKWQKAVSVAF